MTTCHHCGLTLPPAAAFCARCGVAQAAPAASSAAAPVTAPPATTEPAEGPLPPSPPGPQGASYATGSHEWPHAPGAQHDPAHLAWPSTAPPVRPGPPLPPRPAQPSAPLRRGPGTGLVVGLIAGGLAVLVALVVGVVLFVGHRTAEALDAAASGASTLGTLPSDAPTVEDTPTDIPSDTPPTEDTPSPTTDSGQNATDPWYLPSGGKVCSSSGDPAYATAATGNDHTSCPFAKAVHKAYLAAHADGSPVTLTVTSPVTHQSYDMTCDQTGPVTCVGGNDAVVLIGNATTPIPQ